MGADINMGTRADTQSTRLDVPRAEEHVPRAAILTWCDNNGPTNYGQILQCYAMQYLVRQKGYEPIVVQYRRKGRRDLLQHNFSNRTGLGRFLNELYERYYNIKVIEKKNTPRVKRFKQFIREYIPLMAPCYTKGAVEDMTKECALLICGSDQIWNPIWFDPIWFLDFGRADQKRVAYAPSGIFHQKEEYRHIYEQMAELIEKLDMVTVREKISVDILRQYTDKEIKDVLDPVCLVPVEEWNRIAAPRLIEEEYVFCYVMGSIRPYQLILRRLMEKYGVRKVVCIPSNMRPEPGYKFMHQYADGGPAEFLSLIRYAKAVCTDSFHGTAMAVLYQKPLYNVKRDHPGKEAFSGSERIENLMDKLGLGTRYVRNCRDVEGRED